MGRKKKKDVEPQRIEEPIKKTVRSGDEFSWTGFSVGMAVGILALGAVFLTFSFSVDRRIKGLENLSAVHSVKTEKSAARPLHKKAVELQNTVGALAESDEVTGEAKKLKEKVDKLSDVLKKKAIENDPLLKALRSQILAEIDEKLAGFKPATASKTSEIASLEKSVSDLQESYRKFQTDMGSKVELIEQELAKTNEPYAEIAAKVSTLEKSLGIDRISALEEKISGMSVGFSDAIESLHVETAKLEKAITTTKQPRPEISSKWNLALESLQSAVENAKERVDAQAKQGEKLSARLQEMHTALSVRLEEVEKARKARREKDALYDKGLEKLGISHEQLRQKMVEYEQKLEKLTQTAHVTGGGLSVNSVKFSHLSEELKTRLAQGITATTVDMRMDFGRIYLSSEVAARELRYELSFSEPFAADPLIWVASPQNPKWEVYIASISENGCEITVKSRSRISKGDYSLEWMAVGKKE